MRNRLILFLTLTVFAISNLPVLAQSRVKVHKDLIEVYQPNEQGLITVVGQAGAIGFVGEVVARLENLTSKDKIDIPVNPDGSFRAVIAADTQDKVRVRARNRDGSSYGTFSVATARPGVTDNIQISPAPDIARQLLKDKEPLKPLVPLKPLSAGPNYDDCLGLAVIITVVDTTSGQVVAAQRIAGLSRFKVDRKESFDALVQKIIKRCINVVQSELQRPNLNMDKKVTESDRVEESDKVTE